jgi:drug/metabolite transporter (DMT)-like permease
VTSPDSGPGRLSGAVAGALLMILAVTCFTALDTILKYLVQRHDPWFLAFGRNLFQVLYLVALMPFFGARRMLAMKRPAVHVGRGALLLLTTVFIVLALRHLPMSQTYAITFSTPLIATVLAALVLHEHPSLRRWLFIVAGFGGVLVALQPTAPEAGLHLLYPLAMASANAMFHVLTRYAGRDEDPFALLFYVAFFALVMVAPALPWIWEAMTPSEWGLLALGGAFGTLAHLFLIEAFRRAPTAVVSPMIYTQIVSAMIFGFVVFGEIPTAATLLGAAIVAASGIALIRARP